MVFRRVLDHDPTPSVAGLTGAQPTTLTYVDEALVEWRTRLPTDRGVLVTTDCLYGDNSAVIVVVAGGAKGQTALVHDDGGAVDRLAVAGRTCNRTLRILRNVARRFGLHESGGAITSGPINLEDLAGLIPLVANASQEAAHRLLDASTPRPRRDLPGEIVREIQEWDPDVAVHREHLVSGASSRGYKFDIFAPLRNGATILIDAVRPDANSVNATFVANLDVGRLTASRFVRAIVFDPDEIEALGPANLTLLAQAAPTIPIGSLSVCPGSKRVSRVG